MLLDSKALYYFINYYHNKASVKFSKHLFFPTTLPFQRLIRDASSRTLLMEFHSKPHMDMIIFYCTFHKQRLFVKRQSLFILCKFGMVDVNEVENITNI